MILMLFYFKNDLSDNYFNGGLPFSRSQDKVRLINLSGNKFDRHIPPTIKGMNSLDILYLFVEPSVSPSEFASIVPSKIHLKCHHLSLLRHHYFYLIHHL